MTIEQTNILRIILKTYSRLIYISNVCNYSEIYIRKCLHITLKDKLKEDMLYSSKLILYLLNNIKTIQLCISQIKKKQQL